MCSLLKWPASMARIFRRSCLPQPTVLAQCCRLIRKMRNRRQHKLHAMIRRLLDTPGSTASSSSEAAQKPAHFAWTEYEQLMISEAVHRGDAVYNIALRIDPNSLMRAAAFQLIRNVLHGSGTVIALRPEDNVGAASVEIVEAALASSQPQARIAQRCNIPSIVSTVRLERAATPET